MSLSSTSNSLHSSGTFHSNSSLNSTPSVDRYAALKDLDEQIRESKEPSQGNKSNPLRLKFNILICLLFFRCYTTTTPTATSSKSI